MDLKIRFKNPYFWIGLIGLFFATLQVDVQTLTSWSLLSVELENFINNPFLIFSFIVALIGYINNPTTKGLKD